MHRKMTASVGATLKYNLDADGNHTAIWGDGTSITSPSVSFTGTGTAVQTYAHGQIVPGQNVPAGTSINSVNVTVSY